MNELITLPNGLRISYLYTPQVRSVTMGVFVGCGSVCENDQNNGISHLIEHMCFKGTTHRSAFDIVKEMDDMGASLNAFTSKEMTVYYYKCLDECVEKCTDILADLVCHPTFNKEELEKEKLVVLEEIDRSEDTPDDLCGDLASEAFWGDDPMARTILGPKENIMRLTQADLFDYVATHYVTQNIVLSVVGNISKEKVLRLAEYFSFPQGTAYSNEMCTDYVPNQKVKSKDVEQANLVVCFKGFGYNHPFMPALNVFDAIFGGGMSSILFQEVREKLGLADAVYSYPGVYRGKGSFCIYLGTNPAKVDKALTTIASIIKRLVKEGITQEQLNRGVMQVKSAFILGAENSMSMLRAIARRALTDNCVYSEEDEIAKLEAVTLQEVNELIKTIFATVPSVGAVSREPNMDYISYFTK